jgi:glycosyltransferase involved in cell wall biosynthesis
MISSIHPLVSILIPAYNRERYIEECICSALSQDYPSFEVVVVDNNSIDNTWTICNKLAAIDSRVRIFRNDANIGPVRNWMQCAKLARGVFCKILFSDDLLAPNCLSVMVQQLSQSSSISFCYSSVLLKSEGRPERIIYNQSRSRLLTLSEFINLLIKGQSPLSPCSSMLRRSDLLENLSPRIPSLLSHQYALHGAGPDILLLLLTASKYSRISFINSPLVSFRDHSDSFTAINSDNQIVLAYRSAISYFLAHSDYSILLLKYLAKQWLSNFFATYRPAPVRKYLSEHESPLSARSILIFFFYIVYWFVYRITSFMLAIFRAFILPPHLFPVRPLSKSTSLSLISRSKQDYD